MANRFFPGEEGEAPVELDNALTILGWDGKMKISI
jgi:hypothetical protein